MFADRLQLSLTLVIGGDTFAISAGSIKHLDLALTPYGFEAEVGFYVNAEGAADALFPRFCSRDLLKATLEIKNGRVLFLEETRAPLALVGYAGEKRVREVVGRGIADQPVVGRHYVIRFVDPAQAFWRQHRPLELYVDTSMKDVIDLHKPAGMDLTYDWAALDDALDVLCVGLGGERGASFYDFVVWYIHDHHGVLELDPGTAGYRIGKTKARGGQAVDLDPGTVEEIRVLAPDPVRFTTTVLNPCTEAALPQKALTNPQAASGVRFGAVAYTLLSKRFEQRVQIETERLAPAEHGIEITYRACPELFLAPGRILSLGSAFSDKLYPFGKKYRVVSVSLRGRQRQEDDGEDDLRAATAAYDLDFSMRLELASDPTPRLPPFERPSYPIAVEGRVLSASGQEDDRTFHALEGERDSLFRYRIQIPLWNKTVVAPYVPNGEPGHFFFPAYKKQRVLVALDFDSARIAGFLEWAGKLSKDTQGDQIVLGFNDRSETIISHVYEESKPVLKVARRLENDTETMTISEGTIFMIVKEEEGTAQPAPSYDVTPNVEAAKAQTSAAVRGSIAEVTGSYESSVGGVTASIDGARGEVDTAVSASAATLNGKIEGAEGELSALSADAQKSVDALGAEAAKAKAELQGALGD